MADYELNLRDYLFIAKKRRGIISLITLLLLASTFFFTQFTKPKPLYQTAATVKYERASTVAGLYLEVITYAPADPMGSQAQVITSFPVLERVAKKLGLVPPDFSVAGMTVGYAITGGPSDRSAPSPTGEQKTVSETPLAEGPESQISPMPDRTRSEEQAVRGEPVQGEPAKPATHVTGISIDRAGEGTRVTIEGDGSFTPEVFEVGRQMVVVDLPGAIYQGTTKMLRVDRSLLRRVRVDQRSEPRLVRVVLDLEEVTPYHIEQKGNAVVVNLPEAALHGEPVQGEPVSKAAPETIEKGPEKESAAEEKPMGPPREEVLSSLQKILDLKGRIKTQQEGLTNIIRIIAQAPEPMEAAKLANTVAETYREENIATKNREVLSAKRFIEAQLRVVGEKLRQAEQALREFKEQAKRIILPDEARSILITLTTLEAEHSKVKRVIDETRAQLTELQSRPFLAERPMPQIYTEEATAQIFALNANLRSFLQERNTLLINYTPEHPQLKELDKKIQYVRSDMIQELTNKLNIYQDRETALRRDIGEHKQDYLTLPASSLQLVRLERGVHVNNEMDSMLKTKLQEVSIKAAERIEEVTLIAPAIPPTEPINAPKTAMSVTVGGLMGLLLGIVAAFTRESLDTSLGTIEDTEEFLGVPVLGVIPRMDMAKMKEAIEKQQRKEGRKKLEPSTTEVYLELVSLFAPKSPIAESYRALRTNIAFATAVQDFKILEFTSASLREGKTTTAINLAITMAQIGKKVLILDADLRQPSIHQIFGLQKEPGVTEVLLGSHSWPEVTRTVADLMIGTLGVDEIIGSPGIDKISIITSGTIPAHPTECISSPKMTALLKELRDSFDLVIIDTPPTLPVTDAVILGQKADGIVLVYQVGQIPRLILKRSKHLLEKGQAKVIGVVLNNVPAEVSPDYQQYRYNYYYSSDDATEQGAPLKPSRWDSLTRLFKK